MEREMGSFVTRTRADECHRDRRSVKVLSEAYKAALNKDWEVFKKFWEKRDEFMINFPMTVAGNTALHIAAYNGEAKLVRDLLEHAPCLIPNERGDTVLHEAAAVGNVEMAEDLIEYDTELLESKNNRGETPLFRAAVFNQTKMVRFLASQAKDMTIHRTRNDGTSILHMSVLSKYFDTALELVRMDSTLVSRKDENGMTCFQLLANMPSAFKSGNPMNILEKLLYLCLPDDENDNDKPDYESDAEWQATSLRVEDLEGGCGRSCRAAHSRIHYRVWRRIAQGLPPIKRLWDIKKQQKSVLKLAQILRIADDTWMGQNLGEGPEQIFIVSDKGNKDDPAKKDTSPLQVQGFPSVAAASSEPPKISAARYGIIEIVNLILDVYPQATEVINNGGDSIFHIAARYRRKEILDRLQHFSTGPLPRIRRKINNDGDSVLHQAAYQDKQQLRDRPGEALHMQSEIQWFKRVRKLVPPYFVHHRNKKNQTAEELFNSQHKELVQKGQAWLMRTTKACTIVAVLIATVAFTCAYTIPGGSNSKTGHPLLLQETAFRTFTISDTLSLCFSLTSVVAFLSIMTSRMQEQDFWRSLPLKLVFGLTALFFSVAAMMVAFSATLVLMIQQRLHWAAIPIYTIACCPVTIFLALQFPLYLNIAWFTVSDILQSFIDSIRVSRELYASDRTVSIGT